MIRLVFGAALIWTLASLPPAFAERSGPGDVTPSASSSARKAKKALAPRSIKDVLTQLAAAVTARDLAKGLALFPSNGAIDKHIRCVDPKKGPRTSVERERTKFSRELNEAPVGLRVRYLSHDEKKVERFPKGTVKRGCTLLSLVTVTRVEAHIEITKPKGKKLETKKTSDAITLMRFGTGPWYAIDL
jgi:hypothetical protein